MPGFLVESPGTAPGSEPFITGAFIAIVRVTPNTANIGARLGRRKGHWQWSLQALATYPDRAMDRLVNKKRPKHQLGAF